MRRISATLASSANVNSMISYSRDKHYSDVANIIFYLNWNSKKRLDNKNEDTLSVSIVFSFLIPASLSVGVSLFASRVPSSLIPSTLTQEIGGAGGDSTRF